MKRKILNRRKEGKKIIRELECGHEQEQGIGGKVNAAIDARCKECAAEKVTAPPPKTLAQFIAQPQDACRVCNVPLSDSTLCDACWINGAAHQAVPTQVD